MEAHRTTKTWPKSTQNNSLRRTLKLLTNCPRRGKAVVNRRRDKCKGRVKQRFAPELYKRLNVTVS